MRDDGSSDSSPLERTPIDPSEPSVTHDVSRAASQISQPSRTIRCQEPPDQVFRIRVDMTWESDLIGQDLERSKHSQSPVASGLIKLNY